MRTCLFCQRKPNSAEHAWPVWLLDCVGRGTPAQIEMTLGASGPTKQWTGRKGGEITVKHLCVPCNTGWMSTLEGLCKPILSPLIGDFALPLDRPTQLLIALWSIKTAMVFEATRPKQHWFYTQDDRDRLVNSFAPPRDTLIWLGHYPRSRFMFAQASRLKNPHPVSSGHQRPLRDGNVTTFAMAHLVIQVLSVRRLTEFDTAHVTLHARRVQSSAPGRLTQIWPIQLEAVQWPPRLGFSESGPTLEELSGRFAAGD